MKKIIAFLLTLLLLLPMVACSKDAGSDLDPVLAARRDSAESYMRNMCTVIWSPEEDILYTTQNKVLPEEAKENTKMQLHADRIYRGMPYAYAGSTLNTFMEYAGESKDGVYPISGLNWKLLSGNSKNARVGVDGSSSLILSWAQLGADISMTSTYYMTFTRGFYPVGDYATQEKKLEKTNLVCYDNGEQKMFASYGQLQKADGLVKVTDEGGHAMMAVSSTVVRNEDGTINGDESYAIILEQTKEFFLAEEHYTDPNLGEVYTICGVDVRYSFRDLYDQGYLPITCKALTDPTPLNDVMVSDTIQAADENNLFEGYVNSNRFIDTITFSVIDKNGDTVQQAALRSVRGDNKEVNMTRFTKEGPELIRGSIDLSNLPEGRYILQFTCRLIDGTEYPLREGKYYQR